MQKLISGEMERMKKILLGKQDSDGAWRFCFENSLMTDAYMIILIKSLGIKKGKLLKQLAERLLYQQDEQGYWKLFHDEKNGNLSATVEAYFALIWSGEVRTEDVNMAKAREYILSEGGLDKTHSMTKFMLAIHGEYPWERFFPIPIEILLLPSYFPVSFRDFSAYARVHLAPLLLLKNSGFVQNAKNVPDLSSLLLEKEFSLLPRDNERAFLASVAKGINTIAAFPNNLNQLARKSALNYMLGRIETDGSLYSYVSSSFYMVFALLAEGYSKGDPL
ncbi:hypothetical protein [Bacillus sp. AK031]